MDCFARNDKVADFLSLQEIPSFRGNLNMAKQTFTMESCFLRFYIFSIFLLYPLTKTRKIHIK